MLSLITNTAAAASNSLFIYSINTFASSPPYQANKLNQVIGSDEIKQRLTLFSTVTKQGKNCRLCDPELTAECLGFFLANARHLNDQARHLIKLFDNILADRAFQYLGDDLMHSLTQFIAEFCHGISKALFSNGDSPIVPFNKQQLIVN